MAPPSSSWLSPGFHKPRAPAGPGSNGLVALTARNKLAAWERQVSKSSKGSDGTIHTNTRDSPRGQCMFPPPTPRQRAASPENSSETEGISWDLGPEVRSSSRRISKGSGHAERRKNGPQEERSSKMHPKNCSKATVTHLEKVARARTTGKLSYWRWK